MARQKPPIKSAYELAQRSNGAINQTTAHRLLSKKHPPARVDFRTLDTICRVLKCKPSELLADD